MKNFICVALVLAVAICSVSVDGQACDSALMKKGFEMLSNMCKSKTKCDIDNLALGIMDGREAKSSISNECRCFLDCCFKMGKLTSPDGLDIKKTKDLIQKFVKCDEIKNNILTVLDKCEGPMKAAPGDQCDKQLELAYCAIENGAIEMFGGMMM